MAGHHFISYSRLPEAEAFAFRLYDALQAGPPSHAIWLQIGMDTGAEVQKARGATFAPPRRRAAVRLGQSAAHRFFRRLSACVSQVARLPGCTRLTSGRPPWYERAAG